jgi:hypothetical protein
MKKLRFDTVKEFEEAFNSKTKSVTDAIVFGIETAVAKRAKSAQIFELTFAEAEVVYEISLPSSQWVVTLEKCLDYYHKTEESDQAIDTWKLLEAVKVL